MFDFRDYVITKIYVSFEWWSFVIKMFYGRKFLILIHRT